MERGDFDDLPGRVKPLQLVDDRGVPPSEVSALSALGAIEAQPRGTTDPAERRRLMRELSRQDAVVRMKLERARWR